MILDPRDDMTMHLTDAEFGALRERLAAGGDCELVRVMNEAAPSDVPRVEPIVEVVGQDVDGNDVSSQTGEVVYAYAITVPRADRSVAAAALRAEGHAEAADALSA